MTSGYSSKDPVVDAARFQGEGINFRAKLIGSEDVPEARGDKMCQDTIQKLKALVKVSKEHKQKIIVNVSLEGLKIIDQLTSNIEHTHEVHKISFISRDMTDSRAFGYIYGPGDGSHKFFGIKTEKAAESLVLSLRDLFQAVYDLKKKEVEEAKKLKEQTTITLKDGEVGESDDSVYQVPQNGKPVEGTESEYAVPKNNKPVEEGSGGNLLDLQDQLTNIEQGMNTFDSLFAAPSPPVSSAASTGMNDAWGLSSVATTPAVGGQQQQQPFGAPNFGAPTPGTPFPAAPTSSPFQSNFGQSGFGTSSPFTAAGPTSAFPPPPPSRPGFPAQGSQSGFPAQGGQSGFPVQGGGQSAFPGLPSQSSQTGFPAPGGQPVFPPSTAAGFGAPQASPFGAPASTASTLQQSSPFQTPVGPTGLPVSSDPFANDPFSSPNPLGGSAGGNAQPSLFGSSSGNPFGSAPSSGGSVFPQSNPASSSSVGWPNESVDILAPMKIVGEADKEPEVKNDSKDLFGDLCDIGSITHVKKTPKDLFKEKTEPPKKSLNQLKAERDTQAANPTLGSPAASTAGSPLQSTAAIQPTPAADPFGLSSPPPPAAQTGQDPFGSITPTPTTQQQASEIPAHDPFGPLSKEVTHIPDLASTSADPFDTSSILHLPSRKSHTMSSSGNTQPSPEHNHQRPRPRPKKPDTILNGISLKKQENVAKLSDNDFDLPSPEEPPPPLPSDALLHLSKNAPPPPPRPTAKKHPSPVPATRSSSFKTNLSVQSTHSGFSSSSEDQDNLSSLSPGSGTSSCDASPQPAIPRRTKLSTPSHPPESNPPPLVLNSSNHVANTNTAVHKPPVPKPRKSLSHKSSIGSADGDSIKTVSDPFFSDPFPTDPFATDPFPPITTDIDFHHKDHNDNDPFLSSQTFGDHGDFESKWEAFSDFDNKSSSNFNDKFSNACNESQQNGNTNTSLFGDPF